MDTFTKEQRSRCMSLIRSKNTEPEIKVRKILYSLGFRYRLHKKDLPGKPDIVISRKKTAIFVNGCFWHQHEGCKRKSMPKTNTIYWREKLRKNVKRQKENIKKLEKLGWKVLIVWECEVKNDNLLERKLKDFLYD